MFFGVHLSYTVRISGTTLNLSGIFVVLFTIIPSVYFLTIYIKRQEGLDEKDIEKHYSRGFWMRHDRDILVFLFYFGGLTASFALWSFFCGPFNPLGGIISCPADTFQIQLMKVQEIRSVTGNLLEGSGVDHYKDFGRVFGNNMQVLGFAFLFSLLFGAGAVFIVVWNASILGSFIGKLSETFFHIPGVSLNFLPHGIPEIGGYLLAGLAGGLISAAVIRGHRQEILMGIIMDAVKLLALSVLFIFLGALIETMDMITRIVSIFIFYTIFIYIITIALTPVKRNGK
jgi:hypothetical protein